MIVVIGGGPAGIAAALAAAKAGKKVFLIDSRAQLGGQFWRHSQSHKVDEIGERLQSEVLNNSKIELLLNATAWRATYESGETTLHLLIGGRSQLLQTRSLILATGAYDRSLPFPGWDIPGVMTAGAAQALLKGSNVLAGKKIVVAGTGPFLLPVALGLSQSGGEVAGLFEANRMKKWFRFPFVVLINFSKMRQGLRYISELKKRSIPLERGYAVISANSTDGKTLESVTVAKVDGNFKVLSHISRDIDCDALAISWGFTADLSIAGNLGVKQNSSVDGGLYVEVDVRQETNMKGIFAAGEITGIGGAELALIEGTIAGESAAGVKEKNRRFLLKRWRARKFAKSLLRVYPAPTGSSEWYEAVTNETIVCRCEEVSLGEIKSSIHDLGATDPRSVKLFSRAGMGMCQGRICGRSILDILSQERREPVSLSEMISFANRPIVAPISLGELAQIPLVEYESDNH